MSNILEQMLKASKEQLELEFEHKKELAQIKSCQNNEIKELQQKYKKKISDLEAKLAESEKKAYSRGHSQRDIDNEIKLNALREDVLNKEKRIVELKQQLAEKDEKIEKLKSENHALMSDNAYQEADVFELTQKLAIQNQDKISFAIEQLEKVLKTLEEQQFFKKEDTAYCVHPAQIAEYISNQIKQLKEKK